MAQERRTFWEYLFVGSSHDGPEEKVLDYVVHRVKAGAHLRDVVDEDYVRRNATQDQIDRILGNPDLVHAARERMELAFRSEELRPDSSSR